jgi:hypothetical protein
MRRLATLAFLVACGSTPATPDANHLDAHVDAPPDAAGSGSAAVAFQASPRDRGLDVSVLAFGLAIVVVPMPRKRRNGAKAADVASLA